ncbi:MAG: Chromosome partitioning protein ParB family [Acidobacteriaceae bacterium]|nr:Chromosome partitioning protein ParB family [Acidobacteriaceae bacterium]
MPVLKKKKQGIASPLLRSEGWEARVDARLLRASEAWEEAPEFRAHGHSLRRLFTTKVAAHIDRELAARPHLVQIETTWRPAKEQRPGVLSKHSYRELDKPDNPDAEPPCPHTQSALIVFGRHAGNTITVCTDSECPVHDLATAARHSKQEAELPTPVMEEAREEETEEEAEQRKAEYEQRRKEHEAEQERREEERRAEFEKQQKEYEAEQKRREKVSKTRTVMFERILDQAPAMFTAAQLRTFLRLLVHIDPYSFLEEVASHFAGNDENAQQTDEEIVLAAIDDTADDKLTSFALRVALTDYVSIPRENGPDPLSEAEAVFAPPQPKSSKKNASKAKETPTFIKTPQKKSPAKKQKAA